MQVLRTSRVLLVGRALAARRLSFLADLRSKVSDELAKNSALQQSLKELRGQTSATAAPAAGDASTQARAAARGVRRRSPRARAPLGAHDRGLGCLGARAPAPPPHPPTPCCGRAQASADAEPSGGARRAAEAAGGAGGKADPAAEGGASSAPPQQSAFAWLRALLSEAAAPPASATPERAPGDDDTSTTSVVVKPPSAWEQAFNRANDSPLLGGVLGLARGLFGGLGAGASTIGDKVFGENESTEVGWPARARGGPPRSRSQRHRLRRGGAAGWRRGRAGCVHGRHRSACLFEVARDPRTWRAAVRTRAQPSAHARSRPHTLAPSAPERFLPSVRPPLPPWPSPATPCPAQALARLKERDAAFSPGPLVAHCEAVVIPAIIAAYLAGDLAKLKERCVDAAFASLHSNVRTR
jgi:hypothetical protein